MATRRWALTLSGAVAASAGWLLWRSPRSRRLLRRWATVLGLGGRTTARAAVHQVRQSFAGEERRRELVEEFQIRSAEDAAATLGSMKGAFMKAGQLLSFVDDGLPEPVRVALSQLQDSAPPMTPELAASVIRDELGDAPEGVFRQWDPTPLAAASIGQVHRAVLHDGTVAAVKVQYPGIDQTMEADLAQLDLARMVMPAVWRHLDADAVTAELRARLTEELDYELEAANQCDFAAWYSGHPFIRVPAVVQELSTKHVLTAHLADGSRFGEAERWDQGQRDLAAEAIFRFVHRSFYDRLAFNGDPHPGNYLFHGDGVVSFLDFGLVKRLAREDRDATVEIARAAAISPDPKRLRRRLEDVGYYVAGAPLSDDVIVRFSDLFWGHFLEDRRVTLTAEWASDVVRRYLIKEGEFREVDRWGAVPPQFVILQRITVGLLAILGRLNATANWRRILLELWFGEPPATPLGELEAEWIGRSG